MRARTSSLLAEYSASQGRRPIQSASCVRHRPAIALGARASASRWAFVIPRFLQRSHLSTWLMGSSRDASPDYVI
jgi:hypothetical protein